MAIQCPECIDYLADQPNLIGACASVGIEHGLTTVEALGQYLATYHLNNHIEPQWRQPQPSSLR